MAADDISTALNEITNTSDLIMIEIVTNFTDFFNQCVDNVTKSPQKYSSHCYYKKGYLFFGKLNNFFRYLVSYEANYEIFEGDF